MEPALTQDLVRCWLAAVLAAFGWPLKAEHSTWASSCLQR